MVKQRFTQVTPTLRKCKFTQVTPERSRKSIRCVKRRTKPPYHLDKEEAREYLRNALVARNTAGHEDCSTCPERLIFDHLWLGIGAYLADSKEDSNPLNGRWSYVDSTKPKWWELTHVDIWSAAQNIQQNTVKQAALDAPPP